MKRIKSIIALVAVALTLGLGSCSKSSTTANPADEFASALDKLAKQTESIKSQEESMALQSSVEAADAIAKENASYELTPADKENIKKAMSNFMRAAFVKAFELQGQEVPEGQLDMMVNMATASVDNATTLGDLSQPMGGTTEAPVEEVGEPVTLPDSIPVAE
ncbi:MAG: hypothetical protein K2K00_00260 [Muribaculaceae bacterium]|nr:hypothetical protein [Muribaculaceae bacterium]